MKLGMCIDCWGHPGGHSCMAGTLSFNEPTVTHLRIRGINNLAAFLAHSWLDISKNVYMPTYKSMHFLSTYIEFRKLCPNPFVQLVYFCLPNVLGCLAMKNSGIPAYCGPGARFTNGFLPAIQIRWKLRLAITLLLAIRSQHSVHENRWTCHISDG